MSLKIAVYGKTGQLARALNRQISSSNHEAVYFDRNDCDLSDTENLIDKTLNKVKRPDVVVIAAAYTQVDQAETDQELAYAVNAIAPTIIAEACAEQDIPLVHISTDYVFDGTGNAPYTIADKTSPQSVYGASKLAGEEGVLKANGTAAILRTSWVFDGTGANFLTTMLRLSQTRTELGIVSDQIGRPTYAGDLAGAVLRCAQGLVEGREGAKGVFHVSGSGDPVSWAGFARAIFDTDYEARSKNITINQIPTTEYPTPAKRPAYSVLDLTRFEDVFEWPLPDWRDGLKAALAERNDFG